MKTSTFTKTLGVLALLGSSASMAATVTITASNLTPNVGNVFTMTVSGTIDGNGTVASTFRLAFDATKVAYTSGTFLAPFNVYTKNSPAATTPTVFDVEAATAQSGAVNIAVLTFTALASGAAGIVIDDDGGGCCGIFDAVSAEAIPTTYTQANVIVQAPVVPVPAAAWLFVSALGGLAGLKRRKTQQA